MALTEAKLEYHRRYREAHRDQYNARSKRWHEVNGKSRYYENVELTRAIKRKCYYKLAGNLLQAEKEQDVIDALREKFPRKPSGSPTRFSKEEMVVRRKATVRKARYKGISGIAENCLNEPKHCELCGGGKKISMDHCHETRKFRGWLCDDCNLALGRVKENIDTLEAMIAYLKKHKEGG